jgi:hypothetical protein
MREVVGDFTQHPPGAIYFQGSKPIDGVWATSNITVWNEAIVPVGYGIGDHRLFVADFSGTDMIGISHPRVVRSASRRLNAKFPRLATEYVGIMEDKVIHHRLIERMGAAHRKSRSRALATARFNCLDRELGQCMHHGEKKCRKIKSGRIPFYPKASLWKRRTQVYWSLLRFKAGRIKSHGNLKRAARWCNIPNAICLSPLEKYTCASMPASNSVIISGRTASTIDKSTFTAVLRAREKEDEEAERQILAIIQREKDKNFLAMP